MNRYHYILTILFCIFSNFACERTNATYDIQPFLNEVEQHKSKKYFFGSNNAQINTFPPHVITESANRMKRTFNPLTVNYSLELHLKAEEITMMKAAVDKRYLVGYDCRYPETVKPVSSFISDPCEQDIDDTVENYSTSTNDQYQIVQYETRREFKGFRCEKYESKFTFYCGVYDHATPLPSEIYARKPVFIDPEVCKQMYTLDRYTAGDGTSYSIKKDQLLEIQYYVGGSSVQTRTSFFSGPELSCDGTEIKVKGVNVENMVSHITEEVLFREETFVYRKDEQLIAFYNNVRLNCPIEAEFCSSNSITYSWKKPTDNYCPLYHIKYFVGDMITHKPNPEYNIEKQVIMSTDQNHVRFAILGKTTECDATYYTTSYPDILVRKITNRKLGSKRISHASNEVIRPIPKDEIKISNFITNRDDFIVHYIDKQLTKEFATVLYESCKESLKSLKTEHFLDRNMPGYHTYRLGGANYLTTSGEVVYYYKCKPTLVSAIAADSCYDALPIQISNKTDILNYQQENGEEAVVPKYFLEPLTHRITLVAKMQPCISKFFARYKDIFNRWFAVTPKLDLTEAPENLDLSKLQQAKNYEFSMSKLDLSQGGIYDPADVDNLILWLENNRREDVVVSQLAHQVGTLHAGQYISPTQLFPAYTLQGGSWHSFILGKIIGFFRGLGEFFSTLFGAFVFIRIGWYVVKTLMNCRYLYGLHGLSPNILWSVCSDTYLTRSFWIDKIQRAKETFMGDFKGNNTQKDQLSQNDQPGKKSFNLLTKNKLDATQDGFQYPDAETQNSIPMCLEPKRDSENTSSTKFCRSDYKRPTAPHPQVNYSKLTQAAHEVDPPKQDG